MTASGGDDRDDLACLHPDDVEAAEALGRVRAWDEPDVEPDDGDGPGADWDDGPEPPPGRRVTA